MRLDRPGITSEHSRGDLYAVVSTKNCTIAARRIPPSSPWGPRLATERFWLLHRSREHGTVKK